MMFFRWLRRLLLWHTCQWDGHVWDVSYENFRMSADGKKQFQKRRVCLICQTTTTDWE